MPYYTYYQPYAHYQMDGVKGVDASMAVMETKNGSFIEYGLYSSLLYLHDSKGRKFSVARFVA